MVSSRDLALWGYLHLNKGSIHGKQILAKEVLDLADDIRENDQDHNRILGWYHHKNLFYASGAAGCHCVVFPEKKAVGVRMFNQTLFDCL